MILTLQTLDYISQIAAHIWRNKEAKICTYYLHIATTCSLTSYQNMSRQHRYTDRKADSFLYIKVDWRNGNKLCIYHRLDQSRPYSTRLSTPWAIKNATFIFWTAPWNTGRFQYFLACDIGKKLDANDCIFAQLILILSLHYLVKFSSCSLSVYNDECILGSTHVGSEMINWIATNTISN